MFRIGINGADLEGSGTGVKRYLLSILPRLNFTGKEYFIYSRSPLGEEANFLKKKFHLVDTGHARDYSYTKWEQLILPRYLKKDSIDIFFSAGYSIPLRMKIPSLVVIHDLSFDVYPQWYGFTERIRRRLISKRSAMKANKVLTVSNFSKSELISRYGLSADRIVITPNGVDYRDFANVTTAAAKSLRHKYSISCPFILAVGLLLERRYIPEIIEAFAKAKESQRNLSLVLVGKNQLNPPDILEDLISRLSLEDSLIHLDHISQEELIAFYHAAELFIYLSDYEGFGIPPLEAMAAGAPVITSNKTALSENYRGSALLLDDHEPDAIALAMTELLGNVDKRKVLIKKGSEKAKATGWEPAGEIINREIERLIEDYLISKAERKDRHQR